MMGVALLLAMIFASGAAHADGPLVLGVDHTPIVVGDLEKAQEDFRAMGFVIKPGRFHADGIRNAHVKFPDGTELELITAPAATDALTREYHAKQSHGDGPVYFGLKAADLARLKPRIAALGAPVREEGGALTFPIGDPRHALFFGLGGTAPTDRPAHFAHENGGLRLSGFWVRGNREQRDLLSGLGLPFHGARACGPMGDADVAAMPRGEVMFVRGGPQDGTAIGARIAVRSLAVAQAVMKKNGLHPQIHDGCGLWLPPSVAHGIWLQFVERR